jgi:SprT protein
VQLDFFKQLARVLAPKATPAAARGKRNDPDLEKRAQSLLASAGAAALVPQVVWNARMRSTAGMAYPRRNLVTLNPRLREFGDEEVDRTLRHELAHLLAHHRAGRGRIAPHGPEWARACRDLGLVDEARCHNLPLPRRQMTARHFYRCPSCAMELRRVRPLRRKSACLVCCRQHNGGRYDPRFQFTKTRPAV